MFSKILVAMDGSPPAQEALRTAAGLARSCGALLTIVTVPRRVLPSPGNDLGWDSRGGALAEVNEVEMRTARRILDATVSSLAGEAGFFPLVIEADEPYEGILKAAEDAGAELVVMGSHGRRGHPPPASGLPGEQGRRPEPGPCPHLQGIGAGMNPGSPDERVVDNAADAQSDRG